MKYTVIVLAMFSPLQSLACEYYRGSMTFLECEAANLKIIKEFPGAFITGGECAKPLVLVCNEEDKKRAAKTPIPRITDEEMRNKLRGLSHEH